jgi:hypothetical protein
MNMSNDADARLSRLLRADAPPEHDAMFRISLIERREQQLLRKRTRQRLIVAALLLVLPAIAWSLADPLTAAMLGGFVIALVAAAVVCVRGLRQAVSWLRSS